MSSSSSAFTPVKPFVECSTDSSPSLTHPQEVDPPAFLPTPSPPGWYSSLLTSLWRQEQNNNNIKEKSDEIDAKENSDEIDVKGNSGDKEDSDEKHDKEDSDEIHEKEQTGWSNTGRIMFWWALYLPYSPHAIQKAICKHRNLSFGTQTSSHQSFTICLKASNLPPPHISPEKIFQ